MLHQSGLPPYTQTRTNWSTSDGTAGREPEAPVPPLTQLTQWVPGATDGYHFSGKDTESGPVEGGPNESGGAGDGLPHVDHLLQEPGTFLDAGWFGRAHGVYQRTSSEVRLRRRTPSPTALATTRPSRQRKRVTVDEASLLVMRSRTSPSHFFFPLLINSSRVTKPSLSPSSFTKRALASALSAPWPERYSASLSLGLPG
jgi:hypothetical protein